jgi:hypothetical protein
MYAPKKPVRYIDVLDFARTDRAKKDNRIANPYDRDEQVNRPLELGILFGRCVSQTAGLPLPAQ